MHGLSFITTKQAYLHETFESTLLNRTARDKLYTDMHYGTCIIWCNLMGLNKQILKMGKKHFESTN